MVGESSNERNKKILGRMRQDVTLLGPQVATNVELNFLIERYKLARRYPNSRCLSRSSDALVMQTLAFPYITAEVKRPRDPFELYACELTYLMTPEEMQPRMLDILQPWRNYIEKKYPGTSKKFSRDKKLLDMKSNREAEVKEREWSEQLVAGIVDLGEGRE